jgi:DHA1 family multidrug resistance protein-like MFS transporter
MSAATRTFLTAMTSMRRYLASITMARYRIYGGMVLAARPMYEGLGVHWTMTLLAAISAVLAPAPALFWIYRSSSRKRSPFAVDD